MGCGQAVEVGHDARTSLLGQAALIAGPDLQSCHTLMLMFAIWNTEQFGDSPVILAWKHRCEGMDQECSQSEHAQPINPRCFHETGFQWQANQEELPLQLI